MVIYLSGRIRGNADYREQFYAAERRILEANSDRRVKHEVINPARLIYPASVPDGRHKEESIMKICKGFLDMADAIYLLKGWEDSRGARSELAYFISQNADGGGEIYVEGGTGEKYDLLFGKERRD